jgi:hypothetical protein
MIELDGSRRQTGVTDAIIRNLCVLVKIMHLHWSLSAPKMQVDGTTIAAEQMGA